MDRVRFRQTLRAPRELRPPGSRARTSGRSHDAIRLWRAGLTARRVRERHGQRRGRHHLSRPADSVAGGRLRGAGLTAHAADYGRLGRSSRVAYPFQALGFGPRSRPMEPVEPTETRRTITQVESRQHRLDIDEWALRRTPPN